MPDEYYSEAEAATILGYKTPSSLYLLCKKGTLTKYKFLNTPCYKKEEVDYLASGPEGYVSFQEACKILSLHQINTHYLVTHKHLFDTVKLAGQLFINKQDIENLLTPRKVEFE